MVDLNVVAEKLAAELSAWLGRAQPEGA